MVLTAQTQRTVKVLTAFATVGVGIQAIFFSDYDFQGYEGQEHVFSSIQKDTRSWIDRNIYKIDLESPDSKSNPKS